MHAASDDQESSSPNTDNGASISSRRGPMTMIPTSTASTPATHSQTPKPTSESAGVLSVAAPMNRMMPHSARTVKPPNNDSPSTNRERISAPRTPSAPRIANGAASDVQ